MHANVSKLQIVYMRHVWYPENHNSYVLAEFDILEYYVF